MVEIKRKIIDFIKKTFIKNEIDYNKFIFDFLVKMNKKPNKFKITINTKCLVLSQYPGAETKGLGGLIAQYPKNFEVLCFTNGSNMLKEFDTIKSASIKKQQFSDVMKSLRVKGYKIFDIDSETLKNHYSTFRKIDISEADYIFIPNIFDNNQDTLALLKHFRMLLEEKQRMPLPSSPNRRRFSRRQPASKGSSPRKSKKWWNSIRRSANCTWPITGLTTKKHFPI